MDAPGSRLCYKSLLGSRIFIQTKTYANLRHILYVYVALQKVSLVNGIQDCLPDNYNERMLNLNFAMYEITLSISEETVQALKLTPEKLDSEILLAAAVKLYELGRLSSGAAANLARIPRVVFLSKLAEFGVDTFRLTESELAEDLANA
jgi:predicted HTH domain antitoxin